MPHPTRPGQRIPAPSFAPHRRLRAPYARADPPRPAAQKIIGGEHHRRGGEVHHQTKRTIGVTKAMRSVSHTAGSRAHPQPLTLEALLHALPGRQPGGASILEPPPARGRHGAAAPAAAGRALARECRDSPCMRASAP